MEENKHRRLPNTELALMQIIWDADTDVTAADIFDRIEPAGRWAYTTVLSLLTRLVSKEYLRTRKQGRLNVYRPMVTRQAYLAWETADYLNRVHNGSLVQMVQTLWENHSIEEGQLVLLSDFIVQETGISPLPSHTEDSSSKNTRWQSWYQRYFK